MVTNNTSRMVVGAYIMDIRSTFNLLVYDHTTHELRDRIKATYSILLFNPYYIARDIWGDHDA
jgi:hypothetical protein